jgi:hypothetical protein
MSKTHMNLYHISQTVRRGYDTYSAAIVCAPDAESACKIHPGANGPWVEKDSNEVWDKNSNHTWADRPAQVKAELIGTAVEGTPTGVILASFDAG